MLLDERDFNFQECERRGHKAKWLVTNLRDFERGFNTLAPAWQYVPAIGLEGTCRRCGEHVHTAQELPEGPAKEILKGLMSEVARLRDALDKAEACNAEIREKWRRDRE